MSNEKEVGWLREELLLHSKNILELTTFAVGATTLLIGYGITSTQPQAPYVPLVAIPLLWCCLWRIEYSRYAISLIGSYLEVFAAEQIPWERRRRVFTNCGSHVTRDASSVSATLFASMATIAFLVSFVSLFDRWKQSMPAPILVVFVSFSLGVGWYAFLRITRDQLLWAPKPGRQTMIEIWENVAEEENRAENESVHQEHG